MTKKELWSLSRLPAMVESLAVARKTSLVAALLVAFLACACSPGRRTDVHSARAHDLMMQARAAAGNQTPDYTQPIWLEVIEELSQVDERYVGHDEDMALLEEIKTVRAAAFLAQAERESREAELREKEDARVTAQIDEILTGSPFSPGGGPAPAGQVAWDIQLETLKSGPQGGRFYVSGQFRNMTDRILMDSLVLVDYLDARGHAIGTAQTMIDPNRIPPGGFGAFRVQTRDTGVRSFRLKFRELSGTHLTFRSPEESP